MSTQCWISGFSKVYKNNGVVGGARLLQFTCYLETTWRKYCQWDVRMLWGLLLLLESAAVLHACRLVSFENLVTTWDNSRALSLVMVSLVGLVTGWGQEGLLLQTGTAVVWIDAREASADRRPDDVAQESPASRGRFLFLSLDIRS